MQLQIGININGDVIKKGLKIKTEVSGRSGDRWGCVVILIRFPGAAGLSPPAVHYMTLLHAIFLPQTDSVLVPLSVNLLLCFLPVKAATQAATWRQICPYGVSVEAAR